MIKKLKKKEKISIGVGLFVCILITVMVVFVFVDLNKNINDRPVVESTAPVTSDIDEPVYTGDIFLPVTDGPVFFGTASSISVDCIDKDFVKGDIIDKLFYMGIPTESYTITDGEVIVIKIGVKADKQEFRILYEEMLGVVYSNNVSQHLEDGESVDNNAEEIVGELSFLTINLHEKNG